ncbi:putative galactokinase [Trypanosoma cruzi]|uniref:Galactokinase, putative n=2 Tax=Trypanosoma cruzi TaxID=5693 RepID=Q4DFH6_TRYCC|nr:galactokinase, putative [Trypanosoma cruzi]EAN91288.1 galactokinase, putative [Trypanosoma cruzi]PWV22005.1 putative galactokinase [Trypanosoma cruzi]RNC49833.1 putative galactokinase [Trypanosoma cruzi]|eukprot:XP_813139.1 galactokinase [Trypanosoma cruzi strain CL Brener]
MPSYSDKRIHATVSELKLKFLRTFNVVAEDDVEWLLFTFAPGRVNFFGEHVDYMGGYVCPAALKEGCHILVGRVRHLCDGKLRFATEDDECFVLDRLGQAKHDKNWRTFVRGAATLALNDLGMPIDAPELQGFCAISKGTLPMGSGMSASASFDVALLNAITTVATRRYRGKCYVPGTRFPILPPCSREERIKLTKQAHRIETEFCGVNVGIMDQFSAIHATEGSFMALDCDSLTFESHPLSYLLGDSACFLLINSMIRHELTGSTAGGYNTLRSDAEGAQAVVKKHKMNNAAFTFRDLARNPKKFTKEDPVAFVESCRPHFTPGQYDRGIFNIAEQIRTLQFIELCRPECPLSQEERFRKAGELLNATHQGQRDLLKISTEELNFIHRAINLEEGVSGGRLMGGGFGGCILLLLKKNAVESVVKNVQEKFKSRFGLVCDVYPVVLGDGAFVASLWQGVKGKL